MFDQRIIEDAIKVLKVGGMIIYPTETLWGIGCDATNEAAVGKLSVIKKRDVTKGYIIMVDGLDMLSDYVELVSGSVKEFLFSEMPTTIVFPTCCNLPDNVIRSDGTVAFRVAKTKLCKELIQGFGKPLVSTSANLSNEPPAIEKQNISSSLITSVDCVIDLPEGHEMSMVPSRIFSVNSNGSLKIIR